MKPSWTMLAVLVLAALIANCQGLQCYVYSYYGTSKNNLDKKVTCFSNVTMCSKTAQNSTSPATAHREANLDTVYLGDCGPCLAVFSPYCTNCTTDLCNTGGELASAPASASVSLSALLLGLILTAAANTPAASSEAL